MITNGSLLILFVLAHWFLIIAIFLHNETVIKCFVYNNHCHFLLLCRYFDFLVFRCYIFSFSCKKGQWNLRSSNSCGSPVNGHFASLSAYYRGHKKVRICVTFKRCLSRKQNAVSSRDRFGTRYFYPRVKNYVYTAHFCHNWLSILV